MTGLPPQEEEPDRPHQTVVTLHRQPSCVVPPKELTFKVTQSLFSYSWLKVIVVGDPGVGKTSFIHRFTSNVFRHDYRGTVGVDFSTALLDLPAGRPRVRLQLWDIAGQERFTWMTRVYYREVIRLISIFTQSTPQTNQVTIMTPTSQDVLFMILRAAAASS